MSSIYTCKVRFPVLCWNAVWSSQIFTDFLDAFSNTQARYASRGSFDMMRNSPNLNFANKPLPKKRQRSSVDGNMSDRVEEEEEVADRESSNVLIEEHRKIRKPGSGWGGGWKVRGEGSRGGAMGEKVKNAGDSFTCDQCGEESRIKRNVSIGTRAGGRNWSAYAGQSLCNACYVRFAAYGHFQYKTVIGWERFCGSEKTAVVGIVGPGSLGQGSRQQSAVEEGADPEQHQGGVQEGVEGGSEQTQERSGESGEIEIGRESSASK